MDIKWQSIYTDQTYNRTFGKVYNCKEAVLSRVAQESNLDIVEGLFIDVFPFDGLPSSKFGFFVWQAARSFLRRYASMKTLNWFLSRIPYEKSEIVGYANSGWGLRKRIIKRREWMSRLIQVPFEDTLVSVPAEYDAYLRCEFDDYMQFPPIEQRVPTHQRLVEMAGGCLSMMRLYLRPYWRKYFRHRRNGCARWATVQSGRMRHFGTRRRLLEILCKKF